MYIRQDFQMFTSFNLLLILLTLLLLLVYTSIYVSLNIKTPPFYTVFVGNIAQYPTINDADS